MSEIEKWAKNENRGNMVLGWIMLIWIIGWITTAIIWGHWILSMFWPLWLCAKIKVFFGG